MRALNVAVDLFLESRLLALHDCVMRYELRGGLSELFELSVEIVLEGATFDVDGAVGERVTVRFGDAPFLLQVEGIVRRARQMSAEEGGVSRYELLVVPPLWLTTRRRDHRIFQDLSVVDIVGEVLRGYGGRIAAPVSKCGAHPPREYCVQYGESDFDFIQRILADEGISFFFAHEQRLSSEKGSADGSARSALTLMDDTPSLSPVLARPVPCVDPSGALIAKEPHVRHVLASSSIETSQVTLRDYDFERPSFNFEREESAGMPPFSNERDLEAYTFEVGQFTTPDGAGRAAQILEEERRGRKVYALETSFAIAPGTRLTVSHHPNHDINGEKLVVRSRTRESLGTDGESLLHHSHECISSSQRFRPPRRQKLRIHGTQTAFVVGKKAGQDEIDVDKYGRVKVRFPWDRRPGSIEGKPTRFIRVSQGWAGQGYGMVLLPRVGDELVVSYLDGDPDEPLIVGRVHNAVYTSPLDLSKPDETTVSIWKSRSSPSEKGSTEDRYNMVRMQDKSGAEMLELRAQRDFRNESLHDSDSVVGHNQTVKVKGSQSTSAGSISMSSGSTISIQAHTSIDEKAGTTMDLSAGVKLTAESLQILVDGAVITSVHGGTMLFLHGGVTAQLSSNVNIRISAGANVQIDAPKIDIAGSSEVNVKGATVNVSGSAVEIDGESSVKIDGGEVHVHGSTVNLNC